MAKFWKNFLVGAGNTLCLFPHVSESPINYSHITPPFPEKKSVEQALSEDWEAVGMCLRGSVANS